jgi:hypothetical protein
MDISVSIFTVFFLSICEILKNPHKFQPKDLANSNEVSR